MTETHLTPEAEKQLTCNHPGFYIEADINRLSDSGRFMADIRIRCAACNLPFHFKGLPIGADLNGACVSFDGLEARIAIGPGEGAGMSPGEENTR